MLSASEERLKKLWLKALAASDPAEVEPLLSEFRDALHEHIEKLKNRGPDAPGRLGFLSVLLWGVGFRPRYLLP
jgi:hypothetical protein